VSAGAGARRRRLVGWGFEGERLEPTPELERWLEARCGRGAGRPAPDPATIELPPPRPLPEIPAATSRDPLDRLAHARGQGLPDLLRLRDGRLPTAPDAVVRPADTDQLARVLEVSAEAGIVVVPWGGGTSVTGGVNPPPGERPVISLALDHLSGLLELDAGSGLATFGAGTAGPALEAALAPHGLTLGHFPQSWELSTLGGWIATRSSGQESLGYGRIEDMVAGLELVAPGGRLDLPPLPASAAGPDLRHLVLGSEGRLGVVTRATVRVRPRPPATVVEALLVPGWEAGLEAVRRLARSELPLTLLRLSDPPETEVAVAAGLAHRFGAGAARWWLRRWGVGRDACLLLVGTAGEPEVARGVLRCARRLLGGLGALRLGTRPGARWLADRFRHPYLRDALLDGGIATDTLETAGPWSALDRIREAVTDALLGGAPGGRAAVLCHLSHPYRDGASLYFTFFVPSEADTDAAVAAWALMKRAATEALVTAGGTVSHHHGVGAWHAPWLPREVGDTGMELLGRAAEAMDPDGVLNPHVLLDPTDRLESA